VLLGQRRRDNKEALVVGLKDQNSPQNSFNSDLFLDERELLILTDAKWSESRCPSTAIIFLPNRAGHSYHSSRDLFGRC
jgi:hypothetical protein